MKLTKELKTFIKEALFNIYIEPFENDKQNFFDFVSSDNMVAVKILEDIEADDLENNFKKYVSKLKKIVKKADERNFQEIKLIIIDYLYDLAAELEYSIDYDGFIDIEVWDLESLTEFYEDMADEYDDENNISNFDRELTEIPPITADIDFSEAFAEIDKIFFKKNQNFCVLFDEIMASGKTTAAVAYAQKSDKFDHIAYINIVSDFRIDFLKAFGNLIPEKKFFSFDEDNTIYENFYNLTTLLKSLPGTNLLIIDNLKNKEDFVLINSFIKDSNFKILIVSETKFPNYQTVNLPTTDRQTIYEKLDKIPQKDIDIIFDKIGNNIFFAKLTQKQFTTDSSLNINELQKQFSSKERRFYHLSEFLNDNLSKSATEKNKLLLKYVMVYYERYVKKFTSLQKSILLHLSILPSEYFFFHEIENFIQPKRSEHTNFIDAVLDLKLKGWIEIFENKIFIPRPIKFILLKKLKPKASNIKNLLDYITKAIYMGNSPINDNFLKYLSASIHIINNVYGVSKSLIKLANQIGETFEELLYLDMSRFYYNLAAMMYEDYYADKQLNINELKNIAETFYNAQNYEKSLYYFTLNAEAIMRKYGDRSYKYGLALYDISNIYENLHDLENAIFYIEEAMSILEEHLAQNDPQYLRIVSHHEHLSDEFSYSKNELLENKFRQKFLPKK